MDEDQQQQKQLKQQKLQQFKTALRQEERQFAKDINQYDDFVRQETVKSCVGRRKVEEHVCTPYSTLREERKRRRQTLRAEMNMLSEEVDSIMVKLVHLSSRVRGLQQNLALETDTDDDEVEDGQL